MTHGEFNSDIDAVIGDIEFKPEFADPDVELSHDRDTSNHEIVTGHTAYRDEGFDYVVQALGRNAPNIEVTWWITKEQLPLADSLLKEERVQLTSGRWTGIVVPINVDVNYSRVFHDTHGWIYETTFALLGTNRDAILEEEQEEDQNRVDTTTGFSGGGNDVFSNSF